MREVLSSSGRGSVSSKIVADPVTIDDAYAGALLTAGAALPASEQAVVGLIGTPPRVRRIRAIRMGLIISGELPDGIGYQAVQEMIMASGTLQIRQGGNDLHRIPLEKLLNNGLREVSTVINHKVDAGDFPGTTFTLTFRTVPAADTEEYTVVPVFILEWEDPWSV